MKRRRRVFARFAAVSAALLLPAVAMAGQDAPAKLSDAQLEQVTGGDGSLVNVPINVNAVLQNISVLVNISNVPVNVGAAVQANVLGSSAQTATVQALQSVTQIQSIGPLPALPGQ